MERNKEIDIMRGATIILMVVGHSGFVYKDFIYLFHMAVFFMISGYLYSSKYSKDLKGVWLFVKRRIKSLWFPCFSFTAIFILLNNFFININVYTNNPEFVTKTPGTHKQLMYFMSTKEMLYGIIKSFLFIGDSQLGGVFWFFNTLFGISIAFCIMDFLLIQVIKKENYRIIAHIAVSLSFLTVGYLEVLPVNMVNRILSCYCLFTFGNLLKLKITPVLHIKDYYYVGSFIISFIALLFMNQMGHVSLNINTYVQPVFLIMSSLLGWIFMYSLCKILTGIKALNHLNTMIEIIGKHTVSIAALHFLAFKLVNLIQVMIYEKPLFLIASYPVCYSNHGWWIAYTFTGVLIPCILEIIYNKAKERIKLKLSFSNQ